MKFAETTVTFQPIQLIKPVVNKADNPAEIKGMATHLICLNIKDRMKTNIKNTAIPKVSRSC